MIEYIHEKNQIVAVEKGITLGLIDFPEKSKDCYTITNTYVEPEARGRGIAVMLIAKVVEMAKNENKRIIPLCSFAIQEFEKNTPYQELLCR